MKNIVIIWFLSCVSLTGFAQQNKGTVVRKTFVAPSLKGNPAGENAERSVSVYLPPGYDKSKDRYPVIYFLHGFGGNDSVMMHKWLDFPGLMDAAIQSGKLRPMILVTPDSYTELGGSFYVNSPLNGDWADYIAKDIVQFIDKNFRTIANRNSRGLSGHSMGGNGALRIGMVYANTFGAVYAMSPAVLDWYGDFNLDSRAFKIISKAKSTKEIMEGTEHSFDGFFAAVYSAMACAYADDADAGNFLKAELPVRYNDDNATLDLQVIRRWEANFPVNMVDEHYEQLKSLAALKLDWGRNEEFSHIPFTSLQFSKKLEAYGITHFAEEYIGDHGNMLDGFDGRIYTEVLPFFNTYLR